MGDIQMKKLKVFIDGACSNVLDKERAKGGWAYIITDDNFNILKQDYGKLRTGRQNSQRSEMEAFYMALQAMKAFNNKTKFDVYCDYDALVDAVNGFSKRRCDRDIWDMIEPLCISLAGQMKMHHIKGHEESVQNKLNEFNNKADGLAKAGINSLLKVPAEY